MARSFFATDCPLWKSFLCAVIGLRRSEGHTVVPALESGLLTSSLLISLPSKDEPSRSQHLGDHSSH